MKRPEPSQPSVTGGLCPTPSGAWLVASSPCSPPHSSLNDHNPLGLRLVKGQAAPPGANIRGSGGTHSLGGRAGLAGQEENSPSAAMPSADMELFAESHIYLFTLISAPHRLTNRRIRTRGLDRDNSHVSQIKAIQQVLAFQYHPCQREYDR